MKNDNDPKITEFPQRFENETPMQLLKEIENEIVKGNVENILIVTHRKNEDGSCALRWGGNRADWEVKAACASFLFWAVNRD